MGFWKTYRKARRSSYRAGRVMGDIDAIAHPRKAPRRVANKLIGRKIVRRLYR